MGGTALLEREGPEDAGAAPRRRVVAEGNEDGHVETAPAVGGLDREAQALGGQDRGEVEEGSADGCDGDPTPLGAMLGRQLAGPVDDDPGPAAGAAAGNEDVDRRDVAIDQLPQQRRTEVAEDGLRAGGENGGHPAAFAGDARMADRVDAEVDAVQPPGLQ